MAFNKPPCGDTGIVLEDAAAPMGGMEEER